MIDARLIARAILRIAPADHGEWAAAMASEIVATGGDRGFAMGCLRAAIGLRFQAMGGSVMKFVSERPRATAATAGVAASLLGLVYLGSADAPLRMLAMNGAAIVLGLIALAIPRRVATSDATALFSAFLLLATALAGATADGAARWLQLGGIAIQPSLVLLPAAIVAHLSRGNALTTAAMAGAALALAWQPDRAMAGVLLVALLAGGRRAGTLPTLAAALAFAATLLRADDLPASAWVDGILFSAASHGLVPGVAVVGGAAILLVAALAALRDGRPAVRAFGAIWAAAMGAATLGNYPTPLVGYGGSAIIGYLLAVACLPRRPAPRMADHAAAAREKVGEARLFRLARATGR